MDNESSKQARERLLDTAERFFCENGYDGTSIRRLTSEAKCNLAAVNYHFGGKENLYIEVFRRRLFAMRDVRLASIKKVMSHSTEATLEELLHSFATAFIEPLVDQSGGQRLIKLFAHEMISRHLPQDVLIKEFIMPVMGALESAMEKICPGLDGTKARLAIFSIVAQLLHIIRVKEMFGSVTDNEFPMFDFSELVDHIVSFSAAGIRAAMKGAS